MKKIFYWLSPLSAIVFIQIVGLYDYLDFGFNTRQLLVPLIGLIIMVGFLVLTTVSFVMITKNETPKRAIVYYFLFTILMPIYVLFSLIITHYLPFLFYLYSSSSCSDFCGIELIVFPIWALVVGAVLNLIALLINLFRKKQNPKP